MSCRVLNFVDTPFLGGTLLNARPLSGRASEKSLCGREVGSTPEYDA
jgi:hypothetical protein